MATGALIGALRVTLGLDSAEFETGFSKAERTSRSRTREIETHMGRLNKATASLATGIKAGLAGFASGFIIEGLSQAISGGLEYASSLGEVAQQLGVTTATLQEYRYAATQVGVSQEQMDAGLAKLTRSLGDAAAGGKAQAAAFNELGVTARNADAALPQIVAGLSKIADPAKRAALEVTIFGKAGQKLDTLLAGGINQVDNLKDAAHRLGIVLSDEQIQKADDTADKLQQVSTVLKARIAGVVADNAQAIYGLADALSTYTSRAIEAAGAAGRFWRSVGQLSSMGPGGALLTAGINAYAEEAAKDGPAIQRMNAMWQRQQAARRNGPAAVAPTGRRFATGGGTGGGGRKKTSTGGGRAKTERPIGEQVSSIMDGLFPDDAQRRELEAKLVTLGKGVASKVLSPAEFERARGEVNKQIAKIGDNSAELKERSRVILDALFPEQAQRRELETKLADLGKALAANLLPVEEYERARAAINAEIAKIGDGWQDVLDRYAPQVGQRKRILDDIAAIQKRMAEGVGDQTQNALALKGATEELKHLGDQSAKTKVSVAQMAEGIAQSLGGLENSIKSGDWLSALAGVLDVVLQLSSIGAFGKKMQANVLGNNGGIGGGIPGRATGGPITAGLPYMVGERGPEMVIPRTSGTVIPNHALRGAANDRGRLVVEPSPLFRTVMYDAAGRVVQQSAPGIAGMGAGMAQRALARQNDRRLA